jgi:hypothetical protein
VTIDNELDNLIREQSLFEDSALEDASAYARMIIKGANRFKGEKENGTERITSTK